MATFLKFLAHVMALLIVVLPPVMIMPDFARIKSMVFNTRHTNITIGF